MDKQKRIEEIKNELARMPKGNLTYKNINGKNQPYLQWVEDGKCKSVYIKLSNRQQIMADIERRRSLEEEMKLLATYSVRVAAILSKHPTLVGKPIVGSENFQDFCGPDRLYVDKTKFIEQWWESGEKVTLITRPRRFGKSLMFSTIEQFFSPLFATKLSNFDKLYIMSRPGYADIAGTYPVMHFKLSSIKTGKVEDLKREIAFIIDEALREYRFILECEGIDDATLRKYEKCLDKDICFNYEHALEAMHIFSETVYKAYGHGPIILIDEYDTPIQEAYLKDSWDEMADYYRSFLNAALKSNPYLERGLLTGVTYMAKESFFSDMNNIYINTVTSDKYSDAFGFTEEEVFNIIDCHDNYEKDKVKEYYDGFTFGHTNNIYNPWSIICYLNERIFKAYWVMSGGTRLISKAILRADKEVMDDLMRLMNYETIHKTFDQTVTLRGLGTNERAIWSLLLCSGCLTASNPVYDLNDLECDLRITNKETWCAYANIVEDIMGSGLSYNNKFCKYLVQGDLDNMNDYINAIVIEMISSFDVGVHRSDKAPERFYHGFVLGMLVELRNEYLIESNRESGLGRYDVMMIPKKDGLDGIIIEFKVRNDKKESSLEETGVNALVQIKEKKYEQQLISAGIKAENIRKYGFAFEGKEVLIVEG